MFKSEFAINVSLLLSAAALNVFISFFATPFISRIFDKEAYGIYFIFISLVNVGVLAADGMYPSSFVVPKYKRVFLSLLKGSLVLLLLSVFLITTGLFLLNLYDVSSELQRLGNLVYLVPLSILLGSLGKMLINWNVRNKAFSVTAKAQVYNIVAQYTYQISHGKLIGPTSFGLIVSDVMGRVIYLISLIKKGYYKDIVVLRRISKMEVTSALLDYSKYPKYIMTGNVFNKITNDLPLYLLTSYYGMAEVGAFGFASRILSIPYSVIGNSFAPVYFQRANELYIKDASSLRQFTKRSYKRMLLVGQLIFGFLFGFGDLIFKFIFSSEWILAGEMAQVLSFIFAFKIISSPFTKIFRVVRKENYGLYINVIISVFRILGVAVGVIFFSNVLYTVLSYSLFTMIGYLITNALVFRVLEMKTVKSLLLSLSATMVIFSFFFLLRTIFIHE